MLRQLLFTTNLLSLATYFLIVNPYYRLFIAVYFYVSAHISVLDSLSLDTCTKYWLW